MPKGTFVEMPPEEHRQLLTALRRARYGSLLALHLLVLCAAGRTPTDIAAGRFCSRSSVYRPVRAYRAKTLGLEHDDPGQLSPPGRTTVRLPTRRRSRGARRTAPPRTSGWCRTRWSGATLAATRQPKRGSTASAETRRRGVHEVGWGWKRAKLVAKDDDPHRVDRLARSRWVYEPLPRWEALVCADDLAIPRLPKVGSAWRPQGTHVEVMTPGAHEPHELAGALELATGILPQALGPRQTKALCRELLPRLDDASPAPPDNRIAGVADNYKSHQAKAVEPCWATHPRVARLFLPTDGPRATPSERACGDVHDGCPRDHRRKRLRDLVADVVEPLQVTGPWQDNLSDISHEPAVTAALTTMAIEQTLATAS